jgi:site-specific DNA-methyltransferase (adenine-specific)
MTFRIMTGDCRQCMRELPESSVDSVVTDPPYEIGFMGKSWDKAGAAFDVETWRQALHALKPGGYLLAFGGTRTYHRLVCAIEDAGFEIRDQIGWVFGSGFPKGTDKAKIPEAWQGWNTALKPAWEPILLARKPMIGTLADNLTAYGVGALNIDGCRIQTGDYLDGGKAPPLAFSGQNARPFHEASRDRRYTGSGGTNFAAKPGPRGGDARGRWPANLIHDGSEEVVALFPREAGAAAPVHRRNGDKFRNTFGEFAGNIDEQGSTFHADTGSAARFFYCAKASREDRDAGMDGVDKKPLNWSSGTQSPGTFQSPNTDRSARNNHPTVKPTELMRYLCRLVTPRGGGNTRPVHGFRLNRKGRHA